MVGVKLFEKRILEKGIGVLLGGTIAFLFVFLPPTFQAKEKLELRFLKGNTLYMAMN